MTGRMLKLRSPDRPPGTPQARIDLYPAFNPMYYAYFVDGLYRLFGRRSVHLTTRDFPKFTHNCLAFRITASGRTRKIFIHASDDPAIPADALDWCDTLGKVNLDTGSLPEHVRGKVVSLGPIFPFRVWNGGAALSSSVQTLMMARSRLKSYQPDLPASYPRFGSLPLSALMHLRQYWRIGFQRLALDKYTPGTSSRHYIFFSSAVWPEVHRNPDYADANRVANRARADFIRACRSLPEMHFDGGIFMRTRYKVPGYEAMAHSEESHEDYIRKTQASCAVFNAPSVKWCHSWKLGEYLALGKAIISLQLVRAVPAPLEHGVHIHYVGNSLEEMRAAVSTISNDDEYRRHLERNARQYHDRYLSPPAMMQRLLDSDRARWEPSQWTRKN
jgi:hypothetical protein